MVLAVLALLAAAAPPIVREAPPATKSSPLLLNSADDLRQVCGDRADIAKQLVCVSWLNGAAQINARFQTLSPQLFPDFCPPGQSATLGRQRDLVLAWLAAHPRERTNPALLAYRKAMAEAFPCKQD